MDRLILHCDLNNFYASVECVLNPELRDVPLAVAGDPEKRHGVILAKNELAKSKGIRTGDVIWEAKQKEPALVIVPPHFSEYTKYSDFVFELYGRYTPQVEPFGADECYLDCTGCLGKFSSGRELADDIRRTIREETMLTASVGVSFNKVFAKLGSDMKKPDATTEITRENFRSLVWGLNANEMLGVGKHTYEKLLKMNIRTIGELAAADERILKKTFGIVGLKLKAAAAGDDDEPVREAVFKRKAESVGHGMTAVRDVTEEKDLVAFVYYLSELVGARLRKNGVKGYGVAVSLRKSDLSHFSRQTKLPYPTSSATEIAEAALGLTRQNWNGEPLRTVTVSVFDLVSGSAKEQLSMFDDKTHEKNARLDAALDAIKLKYGKDAVRRGNLIAQDFIYDNTDDEDFLPFKR